jgi:hypothetical protein
MWLFYKNYLRVVVTSANMVSYDWLEIENVSLDANPANVKPIVTACIGAFCTGLSTW